jgi:hypothetical protein
MYDQLGKFIERKVQNSNKHVHIVDKNPELIANSILAENPILGETVHEFKKMSKIKKEVVLNSDSKNNVITSQKKEIVWLL